MGVNLPGHGCRISYGIVRRVAGNRRQSGGTGLERRCTVTASKGGVGGSMVSVRVGLSTVLFGDVIIESSIHWIRLCIRFVAIFCPGVGALSLVVGRCCAIAAASGPQMDPKLMISFA